MEFHSLEWESPLRGARSKAFEHASRKLRLVEFTRGFVEPDWCERGHIGYVLEGQMDVDFDGSIVRFSAGDGLFIPQGRANRHKVAVVTDDVRLVLVEDA